MDPLIKICSEPLTGSVLINLNYVSSSLEKMNQNYPQKETISAVPEELASISSAVYTLIRDTVDGLNLPIINNRAENKLINLLTICPAIIEDLPLEVTLEEMMTANNESDFKVIDIASGPGSWSSVLLNRYPRCQVTGFTLYQTNPLFRWYPFLLPNPRFTGEYGDVTTQCERYSEEFDVCLCDGGVEMEEDMESRLISKLHLLAGEFLTCLHAGKVGSNAVIKVFKIDNLRTQYLLNVMICAYRTAAVIKPIATRNMSNEAYLICLDRNPSVEPIVFILRQYLSAPVTGKLDPTVKSYLDRAALSIQILQDEAYAMAVQLHRYILDKIPDQDQPDRELQVRKLIKKLRKSRDWIIPSYKNLNPVSLHILMKIYR